MTISENVLQGIYKIINLQNDHFYVGSSVNLKRRNTRHFSELRNNKHNNQHLQAAWNKYGESSFAFTIIELVKNKMDLHIAEDRWLTEHVGKLYCYNIGMAAISPMLGLKGVLSPTWGYRHTPETKAIISAAGTGRVRSQESIEKYRATRKGMPVSEAQKAQISRTLSGEGNFWYGKKRPDHGAKVSCAVEVTDPDGRNEVFPSIQMLRETLKLNPPTVNRALKAGTPLVRGPLKGWSFKYVDTAMLV
jgi:group I intron endonuclease